MSGTIEGARGNDEKRMDVSRKMQGRMLLIACVVIAAWSGVCPGTAHAAGVSFFKGEKLDVPALIRAGGVFGYVIIALSVALVALVMEHFLSIRRGVLVPKQLAEEAYKLITERKFHEAEELCRRRPSFLGYVLSAGIQEASLGYSSIEKAMEDACAEQSARLLRKTEYLSVIGVVAPMFGLLGTVWGMILAFAEFAKKANPQASEFAPGISEALITTLFGLLVAIPALSFLAYSRNRIDEFVAETALTATHVFSGYRRVLVQERRNQRTGGDAAPAGVKGIAKLGGSGREGVR